MKWTKILLRRLRFRTVTPFDAHKRQNGHASTIQQLHGTGIRFYSYRLYDRGRSSCTTPTVCVDRFDL